MNINLIDKCPSCIILFQEDGIQLRYVNDSYRLIYALEVSANARELLYSSLCPEQGDVTASHINSQTNFDLYMNNHSNRSSQSDDVITHMGDPTAPSFEAVTSSWDIEVTTSTGAEYSSIDMDQPPDITSTSGLDTGFGSESNPYSSDVFTNISYFSASESAECVNTSECEAACQFDGTLADSTDAAEKSSSTQALRGSTSGIELWADSQTDSVPWEMNESVNAVPVNSPTSAVATWKSCAICLEELPPHQLLTHQPCGGVLCAICMEVDYPQ